MIRKFMAKLFNREKRVLSAPDNLNFRIEKVDPNTPGIIILSGMVKSKDLKLKRTYEIPAEVVVNNLIPTARTGGKGDYSAIYCLAINTEKAPTRAFRAVEDGGGELKIVLNPKH